MSSLGPLDGYQPKPSSLWQALTQSICTRRRRLLLLIVVFLISLIGFLGHTSTDTFTSFRVSSWNPSNLYAFYRSDEQSPLLTPTNATVKLETSNATTVPASLKKQNPAFHLLLTVSETDVDFCKTFLSSMLLNYPAPTLIRSSGPDDVESSKLMGIHGYLQKPSVQDNDLVMILDGQDVWFQLPSDVFVQQYHGVVQEANGRSREVYGMTDPIVTGEPSVQRYNQTVIFGADKVCWPNSASDPACASVPDSILPKDIYGSSTDHGLHESLNRAKYLNAGTIIGPAKDLRAIYAAAVEKVGQTSYAFSAQSILASLYGEQEAARKMALERSLTVGSRWKDWMSAKISRHTRKHDNFSTSDSLRNAEFSIGLDYTAALFQPLTRPAPSEHLFLNYNDTAKISKIVVPHQLSPIRLPPPLLDAEPPYANRSALESISPNEPSSAFETLDYWPNLDDLPSPKTNWSQLPLLTNPYIASVPAALHFAALNAHGHEEPRFADKREVGMPAGFDPPPAPPTRHPSTADLPKNGGPPPKQSEDSDSSPEVGQDAPPRPSSSSSSSYKRTSWYSRLWYTQHSRALLRRYLRHNQGPIQSHESAIGGDRWWDMRGGRGGVWTEQGTWMAWGEVCGGWQRSESIFGDGLGNWGDEDLDGDGEGEGWRDRFASVIPVGNAPGSGTAK